MTTAPRHPLETARAAWGSDLPDWVEALAIECGQASQKKVAAAIGRSPTVVNQVIARKYPGSMAAVEALFNGVYRAGRVDCPSLGLIPSDECQHWRDRSKKFVNVNSLRVRMFRACKACPRNQKEPVDDRA